MIQMVIGSPAARPPQQFANVIAAVAITPLVLAACAALLFVFIAKLIFALVAADIER